MPEDEPKPPNPDAPENLDPDVLFSQADLLKRGNKAGVEALQKAAAQGSASAKASLERLQRERPELFKEEEPHQQAAPSDVALPPPKVGEMRVLISSLGTVIFQGFDQNNLLEMIGFVSVYVTPEVLIANLRFEAQRRAQGGGR